MKILQNQERFIIPEYRDCATPLVEALENNRILKWIKNSRHNQFICGMLMYLCAGKYDVIVTVGHRTSMVYGFMNRILPRKDCIQVAKEFYFNKVFNPSITDRMRINIYRFSLKKVQGVIVNSSGEIAPYAKELNLPESRFFFIPWPSNINNPLIIKEHNKTILAAGRSHRDWETFFKAVAPLDLSCVVIADKDSIKGLKVPDNVELLTDVSYSDYIQRVKQAMVVVVPLLESQRSTGQVVFLEAMSYGKPTIVTDVTGVKDYLVDQCNSMLYKIGDSASLREAILRMTRNDKMREKIATEGFLAIVTKFNKKVNANEIIKILKNIMASS